MSFIERINPKTEVKMLETTMPRVVMLEKAYSKMWNYVNICDAEVGWLGTIEKHGTNIYVLTDVYLFKQEVHATTTEINPEGLSEFATKLLEQPDGMEVWNAIKLWGHSHVNMGVFPSGQDDSQMRTFAEVGHDYFFRLIANKKGELKIDMYSYNTAQIFLDVAWELLVSTEESHIADQIEALNKQLEEMRKAKTASYKEDIKTEMQEKVRKKYYTTTSVRDYAKSVWVPPHWQANEDGSQTWVVGKYRDMTPEELKAKEEEKKTTSIMTNTTTESGTGGTGSIEHHSSTWRTISDERLQVLIEGFTEDDLVLIASCQSMMDVNKELYAMGYESNYFTWNERKAIWEHAFEVLVARYQERGVKYTDI